jgi:hypothetical protein
MLSFRVPDCSVPIFFAVYGDIPSSWVSSRLRRQHHFRQQLSLFQSHADLFVIQYVGNISGLRHL